MVNVFFESCKTKFSCLRLKSLVSNYLVETSIFQGPKGFDLDSLVKMMSSKSEYLLIIDWFYQRTTLIRMTLTSK